MKLALGTLGASLGTMPCLSIDANKSLPEVSNNWPWMALGVIVLLLAVISLATRRRLPLGQK